MRAGIDTSVIVNVLCSGTDRGDASRYPHSLRLLDAVDDGRVQAGLSTMVLVETFATNAIRGTPEPRAEMAKRRSAAVKWATDGTFELVEVDRQVAELARELSWQYQLMAPDAIVLATSVDRGHEALFTWDSDLLKVGTHDDLHVVEPRAFVSDDVLFR